MRPAHSEEVIAISNQLLATMAENERSEAAITTAQDATADYLATLGPSELQAIQTYLALQRQADSLVLDYRLSLEGEQMEGELRSRSAVFPYPISIPAED